MKGLGRFLENLGECVDGAVLTRPATSTRLFIGRASCPASRWNRPTARRMRPSSGEHPGRARHLSRARASSLRVSCAFPTTISPPCAALWPMRPSAPWRELRAGNVGDLAVSLRGEDLRARPYAHLGGRFRPLRAARDGGALSADDRGPGRLRSATMPCCSPRPPAGPRRRAMPAARCIPGVSALPGSRSRRLRRGLRRPGSPALPACAPRHRRPRAGEYIGLKSSLVATAKAPCSPSGREDVGEPVLARGSRKAKRRA